MNVCRILKSLSVVVALSGLESVHAQFGVQFADSSFTARGYNAVYSLESGQILMLTDDSPARREGYVFLNSDTGAKLSSFFLDSSHGALLTPDGGQLLIAGSQGSIRTMGIHDPTSLEMIRRVQINLGDTLANTVGVGGQFEPTPDGQFIFGGVDLPAQVNFITRYDREFGRLWGTSFQFNGSFAVTGVETYPLPGGDVGFYAIFNLPDAASGGIRPTDVFGLLNGATGELKWSFSYKPPVGAIGNRTEDFRFTFGSDGSFFAHAAVVVDISNIGAPIDTSRAKVVRIQPDGQLAYSKTLSVDTASVVGEDYLDGQALLHFSFDDGRKTQFVVLSPSGAVQASAAVDGDLSSGDGDLTATRRSGTDFAFVRASYTGGQETLARLNLTNGDLEIRRLPNPFPGNPVYEAVGTSDAYPVSPFNTPRGIASVSKVLASETLNQLSSSFRMGFVELPRDGSFPTCITYTAATLQSTTPLPAVVVDSELIDLENGWTVSAYGGLAGFGAGGPAPDLTPMGVTVEVVCEDDGGGVVAPKLIVSRLNSTEFELSFDTVAGLDYEILRAGGLGGGGGGGGGFSTLQNVSGTGAPFKVTIASDAGAAFYQVLVRN
ncbi:MAG: hypothetical protein AB7O66_02640 [Limisphaerales bacterium]